MKSYRTDGWSPPPRRRTVLPRRFPPVTMWAQFATGGEMCRLPTTTAVRAEHVKLSTVTEAEPPHAHGHGILGSTGETGGGGVHRRCGQPNEPSRTERYLGCGENGFFSFNWAGTRTLQQKLPALFLSLACWGETFSIFPFRPPRSSRPGACVVVGGGGLGDNVCRSSRRCRSRGGASGYSPKETRGGQSSEVGWRRCVEQENGGAVVASADS